MIVPIKLGSADTGALVFEKGSRVTTSDSGIQSCSVSAIYGDASSVFARIPAAGTPFNEVFGISLLPGDFKVDYSDGGAEIEYLEGQAARVTIRFKRPDPNQPPGGNGQRARKVSVSSEIKYQNLVSASVIGYSAGSAFNVSVGQAQDDSSLRFGFPDPVVTVTYNQDARPTLAQMTRTLYIQAGDQRAADFPDTPTLSTPVSLAAPKGSTVNYIDAGGNIIVDVVSEDSTYTVNVLFGPNSIGWKLTGFNWEPHADQTFFDVTETWRNFYSVKGSTFGGITPGF